MRKTELIMRMREENPGNIMPITYLYNWKASERNGLDGFAIVVAAFVEQKHTNVVAQGFAFENPIATHETRSMLARAFYFG